MADKNTIQAVIKIRRETEAYYDKIKSTFIPEDGELCLVDTVKTGLRMKVGNGVTTWEFLNYFNQSVMQGYYFNGVFWEDEEHTELMNSNLTSLYIDLTSGNKIYYFNGTTYTLLSSGEGGSSSLATADNPGIMKLYNNLVGNNTDGTVTQKVVADAVKGRLGAIVDEPEETVEFGPADGSEGAGIVVHYLGEFEALTQIETPNEGDMATINNGNSVVTYIYQSTRDAGGQVIFEWRTLEDSDTVHFRGLVDNISVITEAQPGDLYIADGGPIRKAYMCTSVLANGAPAWYEFGNKTGDVVLSFNGRTGAVTPAEGDYTAEMVGAVPTTRTVNGMPLSSNIAVDYKTTGALPFNGTTVNGKTFVKDSADAFHLTLTPADIGAASADDVSGAAEKLETPVNLSVNLASGDAASFDGSADATLGVTGILPLANGGTGATTIPAAQTALGISTLQTEVDGVDSRLTEVEGSYVPQTRTINTKPLSGNIALVASDVGAVPTTRTINSKKLDQNITLNASDVKEWVGVCTTNSDVIAKTVSIQGFTKDDIKDFVKVTISFAKGNTATNPTLNINNLGAYPIYAYTNSVRPGRIAIGSLITLVFGGTGWFFEGNGILGTSDSYGVVKLSDDINSDSGNVAATSKAVKTVLDASLPKSATVNNKKFVENKVTLIAADVDAVPITRKVNDKPLSRDIRLTGSDVIDWFGVCNSASNTVVKTVSITNFTENDLKSAIKITVNFAHGNTATKPTLSINGGTAYPLYKDTASTPMMLVSANTLAELLFTGSGWYVIGYLGVATTTELGVTQLSDSTTSTSTGRAATANAVKQVADIAKAALPQTTTINGLTPTIVNGKCSYTIPTGTVAFTGTSTTMYTYTTKIITCSNWSLTPGNQIRIKFNNGSYVRNNPVHFNVNGTGPKEARVVPISRDFNPNSATQSMRGLPFRKDYWYTFTYDGTYYVLDAQESAIILQQMDGGIIPSYTGQGCYSVAPTNNPYTEYYVIRANYPIYRSSLPPNSYWGEDDLVVTFNYPSAVQVRITQLNGTVIIEEWQLADDGSLLDYKRPSKYTATYYSVIMELLMPPQKCTSYYVNGFNVAT